jgi:hypothetical protein
MPKRWRDDPYHRDADIGPRLFKDQDLDPSRACQFLARDDVLMKIIRR